MNIKHRPNPVFPILNLTQHRATDGQIAAGVFDLPADKQARLRDLLTFETMPEDWQEIMDRAEQIADFAATACPTVDHAMIGGAPYLMAPLARTLAYVGITPMFAFTEREVVEGHHKDGSVHKQATFRHKGFIVQETV